MKHKEVNVFGCVLEFDESTTMKKIDDNNVLLTSSNDRWVSVSDRINVFEKYKKTADEFVQKFNIKTKKTN